MYECKSEKRKQSVERSCGENEKADSKRIKLMHLYKVDGVEPPRIGNREQILGNTETSLSNSYKTRNMTCHIETTMDLSSNNLKEQLAGTHCEKQTLITCSDIITERAPDDSYKKPVAESNPPPPLYRQ